MSDKEQGRIIIELHSINAETYKGDLTMQTWTLPLDYNEARDIYIALSEVLSDTERRVRDVLREENVPLEGKGST